MDTKVQNRIPSMGPRVIPPIENLRRLAISDSGFVFDPVSGHSYTVNETGMEVVHLLKQGLALQMILVKFKADYAESMRDIERDVLEYMTSLREFFGEA